MKKINLVIQGGLGNQLFIFALLYSLLKKFDNAQIYLDVSKFIFKKMHEGFLLNNLLNYLNRSIKYPVKTSIFPSSILQFLTIFGTNIDRIKENEPYIFQDLEIKNDQVILKGYWQSFRYFMDIQEELRGFLLKFLKSQNSGLDTIINYSPNYNQVNIAVHVRRGDYLKLKTYGLLSNNYYSNAVNYFQELYPQARFLIFSDDINLVRVEKLFHIPVIYIEPRNPSSMHSLFLMSQCDHFITANSSFSWWAAFLGSHYNKTVTTPKKWFKDRDNYTDLIPPGWIKVENDLI